ncbi:hypothetical protein NBRC10512_001760 [Rhodotorula toruloides]
MHVDHTETTPLRARLQSTTDLPVEESVREPLDKLANRIYSLESEVGRLQANEAILLQELRNAQAGLEKLEADQARRLQADHLEGVSWLNYGQPGTELGQLDEWNGRGEEEGASKCQEALKKATELAEEIAAGVAEMRAAEDDWKHMDACRLALQGLVFYALWTASGTTTDTLTKANLRTMNSHWWFVECVYGWEDLSKALPPTHAPWVPFYRFIGPTLTAKIHCALDIIAHELCDRAVAAYHAAEQVSKAGGAKIRRLAYNGIKIGLPQKDSVRTVLKQFADEQDVEAVLELLPKSYFSGEYMTDEEMMAELRDGLHRPPTGDDPSLLSSQPSSSATVIARASACKIPETQTFAVAFEAERSLLLPPARCRSAPAVLVHDQVDYLRVRGQLAKDRNDIFGGDSVLRQAKEGRREIASAVSSTVVGRPLHSQLWTARHANDVTLVGCQIRRSDEPPPPTSERIDTTDNVPQKREISLSDIDNVIEACERLVLYALQTASRTAGNALSRPELWALSSNWWLVEGGYGWEDFDKALPLTTDDASVAFYRFIGPVLTKKVYDALVIIARQQCGPAVAAFQAAKRLSMAEGPKVEYQVHSGVELGEPRRESVQEVLKQVADDDLIKAVLELLPKSFFSGEPMTGEEILAELRESLEATGDLVRWSSLSPLERLMGT